MSADRARRIIPGGVNSGQRKLPGLEDVVVTRTSGSRIFTQDGREFLDFHAAFGPTILGHNDPDVDRAVVEAVSRIDNPGIAVTGEEIELATRLIELIPAAEKVLFTNTGSEATFHAVRLARTVTGRAKIVKFQGCYHGWHDSVAMNVMSKPEKIGHKDPLSGGILQQTIDSTIVARFNDLDSVREAFEQNDGEVAAIILEPIQHNIGVVQPEPGFLAGLRELATRHGALLIFDEVITGFRHAVGALHTSLGVTPDLVTMGKAFANGFPIAMLGGRAELMDEFSTTPGKPAFFAGTYNGHPVMAAAAVATIDKMRTEPVMEHVFDLGSRVAAGLREIVADLGIEATVAQFGSTFITYFGPGPFRNYEDVLRVDAELLVDYRLRQLELGVLETPMNPKGSKISYAHTAADIDRLLETTRASLGAALRERAVASAA